MAHGLAESRRRKNGKKDWKVSVYLEVNLSYERNNMSLGLEMHLCPIVSSIWTALFNKHTIFMPCTISQLFFPYTSFRLSFISFRASVAYSQPIISYTASTHLIFASLSTIHPIIPLLLLVLIHSKVIVYRFSGMIIFNIPINFIHISLAIETVLLFCLWSVYNNIFLCLVCALNWA